MTPGVFQLILERGFIGGLWAYFSHFFILAVYSTFHILNFASYWQWGLVNSAFYLGKICSFDLVNFEQALVEELVWSITS